jgi:hypothetical protein
VRLAENLYTLPKPGANVASSKGAFRNSPGLVSVFGLRALGPIKELTRRSPVRTVKSEARDHSSERSLSPFSEFRPTTVSHKGSSSQRHTCAHLHLCTLGLPCPCCHKSVRTSSTTEPLAELSVKHSPLETTLQHQKIQATSEPSQIENNNPFPRAPSSYHFQISSSLPIIKPVVQV